jgi:uncharacterized protein YkuJ
MRRIEAIVAKAALVWAEASDRVKRRVFIRNGVYIANIQFF